MNLGGFLAGYGRAREGAADVGLKEARQRAAEFELQEANRIAMESADLARRMQQAAYAQQGMQNLSGAGVQQRFGERTGQPQGQPAGQVTAQTTGQAATTAQQQATGQRPTAQSARERDAAAQQQAATQETATQTAGLATPDGRLPDGTYLTMAEMWERATPEEREAMARSQGLETVAPESYLLGGLGLVRAGAAIGKGARAVSANRAQLETLKNLPPANTAAGITARQAVRPIAEAPNVAPAVSALGTSLVLDQAAQPAGEQAAAGVQGEVGSIEEKAPDLVESGDAEATEQAIAADRTPSGTPTTRLWERADYYLANQDAVSRDIPYMQRERQAALFVLEGHLINRNFEAAGKALSAISSIDQGMYTAQGMLAINELQTANDPRRLSRVLSYYNGTDTQVVPNLDGTWNVEVGGRTTVEGASREYIANGAKQVISSQARQAAAEASALYQQEAIKAQFEMMVDAQNIRGELLKIAAQGANEQSLEVLKDALSPEYEFVTSEGELLVFRDRTGRLFQYNPASPATGGGFFNTITFGLLGKDREAATGPGLIGLQMPVTQ